MSYGPGMLRLAPVETVARGRISTPSPLPCPELFFLSPSKFPRTPGTPSPKPFSRPFPRALRGSHRTSSSGSASRLQASRPRGVRPTLPPARGLRAGATAAARCAGPAAARCAGPAAARCAGPAAAKVLALEAVCGRASGAARAWEREGATIGTPTRARDRRHAGGSPLLVATERRPRPTGQGAGRSARR